MSTPTYKISTFQGITVDGTSQFTDGKFRNAAGAEITLPATAGTLATIGGQEELTQKTLTEPVIASMRVSSSNANLLSTPAITQAETIATESFVTNAINSKDAENDTAHNNLVDVVDRLVTYMQNWISVGNINMNDVRAAVDTSSILPSTTQAGN